jgi:hypothetical protein
MKMIQKFNSWATQVAMPNARWVFLKFLGPYPMEKLSVDINNELAFTSSDQRFWPTRTENQ